MWQLIVLTTAITHADLFQSTFIIVKKTQHNICRMLLCSFFALIPICRAENTVHVPIKISRNDALFERPVILPAKSAIVAKTLLDIVLDPDRKFDMPVTMVTALPIFDKTGVVAIPPGSLLTATIQKKDGGDYISADSIVYRGINIQVSSVGRLMPAQIRPENYGQYIVPPKTKASSVASSFDSSVLIPTLLTIAVAQSYNVNNEGQQSQNLTPLILSVVGIDAGIKVIGALLDRAPKKVPPLVEIPKDSLIVFSLQADTELPVIPSPDTSIQLQN